MEKRKPDNVQHHAPSSSEKPKIAVIDDEQRWLKVFQRLFRNSRYAVDTFSDPHIFLNTIAAYPERYCGIICDINMPHLDGYQVFENLKANPVTQNIPFLMVSGVLTQDQNLSKIQGIAYISKLDDNLRGKVFQELIDVIENWPKVRRCLEDNRVPSEKIEFFCQFFINYHKYFNEILSFVNRMEHACVQSDLAAMAEIKAECDAYMNELQSTCMDLIMILQQNSHATQFIRKLCQRGRTSLNMIQTFQFILGEETSSSQEFQVFLKDCRDSLEKIIMGSDPRYNLRDTGS
jgi:CheY-like chemotaxis protein